MNKLSEYTLDELEFELHRRGYKLEELPYLVRLTTAQVGYVGLRTAAELSKENEIPRTAASNRLAAAAEYGFLHAHRQGRQKIYELSVDMDEYTWIEEQLQPCPICGNERNHTCGAADVSEGIGRWPLQRPALTPA